MKGKNKSQKVKTVKKKKHSKTKNKTKKDKSNKRTRESWTSSSEQNKQIEPDKNYQIQQKISSYTSDKPDSYTEPQKEPSQKYSYRTARVDSFSNISSMNFDGSDSEIQNKKQQKQTPILFPQPKEQPIQSFEQQPIKKQEPIPQPNQPSLSDLDIARQINEAFNNNDPEQAKVLENRFFKNKPRNRSRPQNVNSKISAAATAPPPPQQRSVFQSQQSDDHNQPQQRLNTEPSNSNPQEAYPLAQNNQNDTSFGHQATTDLELETELQGDEQIVENSQSEENTENEINNEVQQHLEIRNRREMLNGDGRYTGRRGRKHWVLKPDFEYGKDDKANLAEKTLESISFTDKNPSLQMYDTTMKDPWSVDEVNLLIEGLRLYGRASKKLMAHIKTRELWSVINKIKEMTNQSRNLSHFMFQDIREILQNTNPQERFTDEEHSFLLDDLLIYGRDYRKLAERLPNKNINQISAHITNLAIQLVKNIDHEDIRFKKILCENRYRFKENLKQDAELYARDIEKYRRKGKHFFHVPPRICSHPDHDDPSIDQSDKFYHLASRARGTHTAMCAQNEPWTAEELELFEQQVLIHGGNSYKIEEQIPTKQRRQIQQKVQHYRRVVKLQPGRVSEALTEALGRVIAFKRVYGKPKYKSERWTEPEHKRFIEGKQLYGRNSVQVARHVGTRSPWQINNYTQKVLRKKLLLKTESNEFEDLNHDLKLGWRFLKTRGIRSFRQLEAEYRKNPEIYAGPGLDYRDLTTSRFQQEMTIEEKIEVVVQSQMKYHFSDLENWTRSNPESCLDPIKLEESEIIFNMMTNEERTQSEQIQHIVIQQKDEEREQQKELQWDQENSEDKKFAEQDQLAELMHNDYKKNIDLN